MNDIDLVFAVALASIGCIGVLTIIGLVIIAIINAV